MKTLVLGLGNPILTDDGVGLLVAARLRETVQRDDIVITETELGGMNLLEIFSGYDRAILIDAIITPNGFPGTIYKLTPSSLRKSRNVESTHGLNFADSIDMGRRLGMVLPSEIIIFAIEASDVTTFGESCTPQVRNAVPLCASRIARII